MGRVWLIAVQSTLAVLALTIVFEICQGHAVITVLMRSSMVILVFGGGMLFLTAGIFKYYDSLSRADAGRAGENRE